MCLSIIIAIFHNFFTLSHGVLHASLHHLDMQAVACICRQIDEWGGYWLYMQASLHMQAKCSTRYMTMF